MFIIIARLIRIVDQKTSGVLTIEVELLDSFQKENTIQLQLNAMTSGLLKNQAIPKDIMQLQGYYINGEMRVTKLTLLSMKLPEEVLNLPELLKQKGQVYREYLSTRRYQDFDEIGGYLYWLKEYKDHN